MVEDLEDAKAGLSRTNVPKIIQKIYSHIQKMDEFLIELEKRVSALEDENGKDKDTTTERPDTETPLNGAGDLREAGRRGSEGVHRDASEGESGEEPEEEV